jgi:hypothetical protein
MNLLSQYLVDNILAEEKAGIIVLLPGGFKPPHIGHFELAKRYASLPNVQEVRILIGPKERDGITREQSIAVWQKLLAGSSKIAAQSVAEDNPLLAAYKYIESAKPGTYALAASNKGDDYERVSKFVAGHAKGAKYARPEINVVELPLDTKPIPYKGRADKLNGKPISASTLRADIKGGNFVNFASNYPGIGLATVKQIYSILRGKIAEITLLKEGGAAGHLAHPYEDLELSFEDIKNMIDAALSGTVEAAQEKLDGQNFMVSYKDGKVVAARNKGQLKDFGANALTLKQVEDTFAGRGSIQAAFTEAMRDLETAINRLSPDQKTKFFNKGQKFVNLEVLYPATANVVPYGATQLRLHNIRSYDQAGNVTSEDQQSARQLQGAIRQVEADNQKTYQIRITDPVTIKKSKDYEQQKSELLGILDNLIKQNKLAASSTIGQYMQKWWQNYITQSAKQYGYTVPENILSALINRWAFSSKDINLRNIRTQIDNTDFANWVDTMDKSGVIAQKKIATKPIETLFLKLGVYVLQNVENLVALNPNDSVRAMKKELRAAINNIKAAAASETTADDKASLLFLKRELTRLRDIGGFKAIVPTEGVVFKYNGKLYKLTGAFAPINQILGYMRF